MANECDVFVTGGTGYMGSRLISTLVGPRESAKRLGLVTLDQMVRALVAAVENPPSIHGFLYEISQGAIREEKSASQSCHRRDPIRQRSGG